MVLNYLDPKDFSDNKINQIKEKSDGEESDEEEHKPIVSKKKTTKSKY